jgi:hypothetical protein
LKYLEGRARRCLAHEFVDRFLDSGQFGALHPGELPLAHAVPVEDEPLWWYELLVLPLVELDEIVKRILRIRLTVEKDVGTKKILTRTMVRISS